MGGLGYDPMGKLMQCLGRAPTGQLQESPGQRPGNSIAQRKSPEGARQTLHKFQYSKPQNALRNGESSNGNLRQIGSPFQGLFWDGRGTQGAALGCY